MYTPENINGERCAYDGYKKDSKIHYKKLCVFRQIGKGYKKAPLRGLDVNKAKNGR